MQTQPASLEKGAGFLCAGCNPELSEGKSRKQRSQQVEIIPRRKDGLLRPVSGTSDWPCFQGKKTALESGINDNFWY